MRREQVEPEPKPKLGASRPVGVEKQFRSRISQIFKDENCFLDVYVMDNVLGFMNMLIFWHLGKNSCARKGF